MVKEEMEMEILGKWKERFRKHSRLCKVGN